MNQKQSASPYTCILVAFILKWEKKTSFHLEIISFIYPKNPKKYEMRLERNLALNNEMRMKWDENETLHLIMMMVKNYTENYLQTIYKNYLDQK